VLALQNDGIRRIVAPLPAPLNPSSRNFPIPLAAVWMLLALAGGPATAADWPLTGALRVHDPSIVEEGGKWWVFGTGAGLHVKYSSDGSHWIQGQPLFTSEPNWWRTYAPAMRKLDVWAPDVHAFNGRFWCYYSVSEFATNHSAIGLLSCSSLAKGDWRDDGFVISSVSADEARAASDPERRTNPAGKPWSNTIDPNLATDKAGAPWLVFGSWFDGIHVVRLDPATMKPTGALYPVAYKPNGIEAPNVVYHDGYYFLFVSIDKCCQGVKSTYKISYGRSSEITGPYLDRGGAAMLDSGGSILIAGSERWKGPGGQTVYQMGNVWLVVYHSYDAKNDGAPALRISDLYWDTDNWPTFTEPRPKTSAGN
jgi:arabinan endo-1,5-alpha-L-arabinosidase